MYVNDINMWRRVNFLSLLFNFKNNVKMNCKYFLVVFV